MSSVQSMGLPYIIYGHISQAALYIKTALSGITHRGLTESVNTERCVDMSSLQYGTFMWLLDGYISQAVLYIQDALIVINVINNMGLKKA